VARYFLTVGALRIVIGGDIADDDELVMNLTKLIGLFFSVCRWKIFAGTRRRWCSIA